MPVIPALGMQRKEDCEFETSLDHVARVYEKKEKEKL